jgi:hypothetical protein
MNTPLLKPSRSYRLTEDDVTSAGELHRDYEATMRRHSEQYGAPKATVDALMFELCTYGLAALAGANCLRRLADLSSSQVREVIGRLIRLRPHYPAITDELIFQMGEQISS